jgi:hypothetical protein
MEWLSFYNSWTKTSLPIVLALFAYSNPFFQGHGDIAYERGFQFPFGF